MNYVGWYYTTPRDTIADVVRRPSACVRSSTTAAGATRCAVLQPPRVRSRDVEGCPAIRESTQQNGDRASQRLTEKNLDIKPTITIRPG